MEELKNKIIKLLDNYDIFDDYEFYNEKGYFPSPSDYIDEVMNDLEGFKEYLEEIKDSEDGEIVEDISDIIEMIEINILKDITKELRNLIGKVFNICDIDNKIKTIIETNNSIFENKKLDGIYNYSNDDFDVTLTYEVVESNEDIYNSYIKVLEIIIK